MQKAEVCHTWLVSMKCNSLPQRNKHVIECMYLQFLLDEEDIDLCLVMSSNHIPEYVHTEMSKESGIQLTKSERLEHWKLIMLLKQFCEQNKCLLSYIRIHTYIFKQLRCILVIIRVIESIY